ncbi:MAG: hypothetical protein COA54_06195 [Thiotrichaceae bacterium]|nr:MAG: hypothetical protein COA54_06195 [Thiotrichaceae bacterium]
MKTALIKHTTTLTTEQTLLIDRFNIVLSELIAKGGITEEYDTYITAISGLEMDVTDVIATSFDVKSPVNQLPCEPTTSQTNLHLVLLGFSYTISTCAALGLTSFTEHPTNDADIKSATFLYAKLSSLIA